MTVNGRSYLTAAANDEPGEGDGKGRPVDLDGGNKHIQSVLDSHGVTLAVCVQTFDVMRVREREGGAGENTTQKGKEVTRWRERVRVPCADDLSNTRKRAGGEEEIACHQ